MTPEADALFKGECVRVVDKEGGVWWTLPENEESVRTREKTRLTPTDYDLMGHAASNLRDSKTKKR